MEDIQLLTIISSVMEKLPSPGKKSEADNTSSYSDLVKWNIHPEFLKKGRTAYLSCLTIVFLGLNPIQEFDLKRKLLIMSEKYCFQGYWKHVFEILHEPFNPGAFFRYHFSKFPSLHEFYGNDLKTMKYIWRTLKTSDPYQSSKAPVKKPQRKRGYDDKGHLSGDSHGRELALPERKKIVNDENINISAKLWIEEVYGMIKTTAGDPGGDYHIPKGGSYENKTISSSNRNDRRENGKITKTEGIHSIFNWRRKSDKNEILASFFYMVIKNRKEKLWFRPQFLFFYIKIIHGKEKAKYYGLVPKIFLTKEQMILSANVPTHKPLEQFTIEEISSMF